MNSEEQKLRALSYLYFAAQGQFVNTSVLPDEVFLKEHKES